MATDIRGPALELWYDKPAATWNEALPVGNGRLGAMVFGDNARERQQLNESTFFTGGPYAPINPNARSHLDEVRRLIFAGKYREAEDLSHLYMMANPYLQTSFQPIGDVWITFHHPFEAADYRRSLDLDRAVVVTRYRAGGVTYTREVFASAVSGIVASRVTADKPGKVAVDIALASPQPGEAEDFGDGILLFRGKNRRESGVPGALTFAYQARLVALGGMTTAGRKRSASGAPTRRWC